MNIESHDRRPRPRHGSPLRGFTLIELLVVVAIIIALLSILLPSMGRAIEVTHRAVCASNERQIAIAMVSYVGDHFAFPGHHWSSINKMAWPVRLRPYTSESHDLYFCPSNEAEFRWRVTHDPSAQLQSDGYYAGEQLLTVTTGFSYGYNDWGMKEGAQPHLGLGGHVDNPAHMAGGFSSVVQPSDMIAIADSQSDYYWDFNIDPTPAWLGPGGTTDEPGRRHDDGANVVFVDGHVDWMAWDDLMRKDYESTKRWNRDYLPHPEYWAY